jgi:hypothetical protein
MEGGAGDGPQWPQYRRMRDGRHVYRIESPDRFTELQRIGSRWVRHTVQVTMYPEMLRVREMLAGGDGLYGPMTASEWTCLEDRVSSGNEKG